MAISPSHRLGQIIGDVLEEAIHPLLAAFASKHGLYLDRKGRRPCRKGSKCSWTDLNGNSHDLDFVLERDGTEEQKGTPVAFVETAWRRYTKHSRNKAQEIQGAIEPLAETYKHAGPFKGAVLAGVFTAGAIEQLKSLGFTVLYFSYDSVLAAFLQAGIDASFDEDTPDIECQLKVDKWVNMPKRRKQIVPGALIKGNAAGVEKFTASLTATVGRQILRILILPLHGSAIRADTIKDAIGFIQDYPQNRRASHFQRYEIQIQFTNGNEITGRFRDKVSAIAFLREYHGAGAASQP